MGNRQSLHLADPSLLKKQFFSGNAYDTSLFTETNLLYQESPQPATRFTWWGDAILHNGSVISEAEFANLVRQVKANGRKVEIIRTSDVTVEAADRRSRLLDEVAIRYEVIPQDESSSIPGNARLCILTSRGFVHIMVV